MPRSHSPLLPQLPASSSQLSLVSLCQQTTAKFIFSNLSSLQSSSFKRFKRQISCAQAAIQTHTGGNLELQMG